MCSKAAQNVTTYTNTSIAERSQSSRVGKYNKRKLESLVSEYYYYYVKTSLFENFVSELVQDRTIILGASSLLGNVKIKQKVLVGTCVRFVHPLVETIESSGQGR